MHSLQSLLDHLKQHFPECEVKRDFPDTHLFRITAPNGQFERGEIDLVLHDAEGLKTTIENIRDRLYPL